MSKKNLWIESFSTLFLKPSPIISPTSEVYQASQIPQLVKKPSLIIISGIILLIIFSILFYYTSLSALGLFTFSILPALIVFAWILKTDRYEAEPKSLVVTVIGIGSCVAAAYSIISYPSGLFYYILSSILVEISFFLILFALDSNRLTGREFNDHLDGVVYGAALGFGYVAYNNFVITTLLPGMVNPSFLILLSLENMFLIVFPALTGWWIGYAKAKYTSINFFDLIAGLAPVIVLRITYELTVTLLASLSLTLRLTGIILIGVIMLSIMYRRISWALEDERLWGYLTGKAPIEKASSK